jgi:hypothetical protein
MRVFHISGLCLGKIARRTVSSASASALSATITFSSRVATSDSAATTSRGASVPTRTLMRFSSSSFWASAKLFRCASRLSMAASRS